MDPDETLRLIRQALADGEIQEAVYAAGDLSEWVNAGGFPPADPTWRDVIRDVKIASRKRRQI